MLVVGFHEVLINSQCITYRRWQRSHPQLGETGPPDNINISISEQYILSSFSA